MSPVSFPPFSQPPIYSPFLPSSLSLPPFAAEHALTAELPQHSGFFPINFLNPNETPISGIKPHLAEIPPGWIVSVGTERSLFDLILAPDTCEGVIVRDINPKIKLYVDAIVLLLRISRSQEEFRQLTSRTPKGNQLELTQHLKQIRSLVESAEIPDNMKQFYLENLEKILTMYLCHSHWKDTSPGPWDEVNYTLPHNNDLFTKLQRYARAGRIITTVGSIDDLKFLERYGITVSVIDISNVQDYTILSNFDITENPLVIETQLVSFITRYHSTFLVNKPLTDDEREELAAIAKHLTTEISITDAPLSFHQRYHDQQTGAYDPSRLRPCGYLRGVLNALREDAECLLTLPNGRTIHLSNLSKHYEYLQSLDAAVFSQWFNNLRPQSARRVAQRIIQMLSIRGINPCLYRIEMSLLLKIPQFHRLIDDTQLPNLAKTFQSPNLAPKYATTFLNALSDAQREQLGLPPRIEKPASGTEG